jgi:hypothetical protein
MLKLYVITICNNRYVIIVTTIIAAILITQVHKALTITTEIILEMYNPNKINI